MSEYNEITANDLVVYKEGNQIISGGYKIDSLFLNNNISPLNNNNNNNNSSQIGGNFSSIFSNLAVPAGLLLLQQTTTKKSLDTIIEKSIIDDNLYEKLLKHSNEKIKFNKKTKKNKKKINKTRKNL